MVSLRRKEGDAMAVLKMHLKASSILEVIVAMVIISIMVSVSLLIFVNTVTSLSTERMQGLEIKAQYYLDTFESLTEEQQEGFIDEDYIQIEIDKKETLLDYLFELRVSVTDSTETSTVTKRKLIYLYDEN